MKKAFLVFSIYSFIMSLSFAKDYKAGEVQSKTSFHYGRFETRFQASDVSGVLSTMFLFENDGWKNTDIWQEIDVEVFGKAPTNEWQTNLIYETNVAGPQKHSEKHYTLEEGLVSDWHVYTVDWTPDYVEWFVDGKSIRKESNKAIIDVIGAKPMLVMFNCWSHSSEGWVGKLDTLKIPTFQVIDYIKVYNWVADSTFEKKTTFVDDFNGSLSNWNTSTHTFDGNVADFATNNVAVKDGYLVLAFSNNDNAKVMDSFVVPEDPRAKTHLIDKKIEADSFASKTGMMLEFNNDSSNSYMTAFTDFDQISYRIESQVSKEYCIDLRVKTNAENAKIITLANNRVKDTITVNAKEWTTVTTKVDLLDRVYTYTLFFEADSGKQISLDWLDFKTCSAPSAISDKGIKLIAHPNPVNDIIHLSELVEFKIIDVYGKTFIEGNSKTIDVQSLPQGHYFIKTASAYFPFIKE